MPDNLCIVDGKIYSSFAQATEDYPLVTDWELEGYADPQARAGNIFRSTGMLKNGENTYRVIREGTSLKKLVYDALEKVGW